MFLSTRGSALTVAETCTKLTMRRTFGCAVSLQRNLVVLLGLPHRTCPGLIPEGKFAVVYAIATRQVQAKEGPAFLKAMAQFMKQGGAGGTSLPPPPPPSGKGMSYKDAGVDIDAGNSLVERIKPACKSTRRAGCDSDLGGFGGLFDLAAAGYEGKDTILVGATDGVGTKLKVIVPKEKRRQGRKGKR